MLNDDSDQKKEQPDAGPKVELEYWKSRMQKITGFIFIKKIFFFIFFLQQRLV